MEKFISLKIRSSRLKLENEFGNRFLQLPVINTNGRWGHSKHGAQIDCMILGRNDNSVRCFPMPLQCMSVAELNDSISLLVFEVDQQDGTEYPQWRSQPEYSVPLCKFFCVH